MKPVSIFIEKNSAYPLQIEEIKYTFMTLLTIAGIPWHFIKRSEFEQVDILFGKKADKKSKLFIEMSSIGSKNLSTPKHQIEHEGIVFLSFDHPIQSKDLIYKYGNCITRIHNDIVLSSFYLLIGWHEQFMRRDRWDRHLVQDSFLYQSRLLHTPLVNQYALLLRGVFQESHSFIAPWPSDKQYAIALSHDVDYPRMIRWIEAFRYVAQHKFKAKIFKFRKILSGGESFWRFKEWIQMEQNYNVRSTFYFCGFRGNLLRYFVKAPDPFYDVREDHFKKIINFLDQNGFEIGLHSSYLAYKSISQFHDEKRRIEKSLGKRVFGNRHHYWHMNPHNPAQTGLIHEQIGFLYDSSIIFGRHSGFRYSICSPFHLYDRHSARPVGTLEMAPTLMDAHLFDYPDTSYFNDYKSNIDSLLNSIRKYGGVFIADYHVRAMNNTFFPDWGESYRYLLRKVTSDSECYCDTLLNISKHWLERERRIQKNSIN